MSGDYRDRWYEVCRLLAHTTAKLEAEWNREHAEGERSWDGWCWAEAQAGRDYLNHHADELDEELLKQT